MKQKGDNKNEGRQRREIEEVEQLCSAEKKEKGYKMVLEAVVNFL